MHKKQQNRPNKGNFADVVKNARDDKEHHKQCHDRQKVQDDFGHASQARHEGVLKRSGLLVLGLVEQHDAHGGGTRRGDHGRQQAQHQNTEDTEPHAQTKEQSTHQQGEEHQAHGAPLGESLSRSEQLTKVD